MLFLIKHLLKHILLFSALTLLLQYAINLHEHCSLTYTQQSFITNLPKHLYNQTHTILNQLLTFDISHFYLATFITDIFINKPLYLIATLLLLIIYYNLRIQLLQQPCVLNRQPKVPIDSYAQYKKQNTEQQLKKLQALPLYKQWKLGVYFNRFIYSENDDVVAELVQKEDELF